MPITAAIESVVASVMVAIMKSDRPLVSAEVGKGGSAGGEAKTLGGTLGDDRDKRNVDGGEENVGEDGGGRDGGGGDGDGGGGDGDGGGGDGDGGGGDGDGGGGYGGGGDGDGGGGDGDGGGGDGGGRDGGVKGGGSKGGPLGGDGGVVGGTDGGWDGGADGGIDGGTAGGDIGDSGQAVLSTEVGQEPMQQRGICWGFPLPVNVLNCKTPATNQAGVPPPPRSIWQP